MMNASVTPVKKTKVEHMVNSQIIFLFFALMVIAIGSSAGNLYFQVSSIFNSVSRLLQPYSFVCRVKRTYFCGVLKKCAHFYSALQQPDPIKFSDNDGVCETNFVKPCRV